MRGKCIKEQVHKGKRQILSADSTQLTGYRASVSRNISKMSLSPLSPSLLPLHALHPGSHHTSVPEHIHKSPQGSKVLMSPVFHALL